MVTRPPRIVTCAHCQGTGKRPRMTCPWCDGVGSYDSTVDHADWWVTGPDGESMWIGATSAEHAAQVYADALIERYPQIPGGTMTLDVWDGACHTEIATDVLSPRDHDEQMDLW